MDDRNTSAEERTERTDPPAMAPEEALRLAAVEQLKKRRDLGTHLLVFVLTNAALVGIWAIATPDSFFWPVIPLLLWGIGLAMNVWDVYLAGDPSEASITRQMNRLRKRT